MLGPKKKSSRRLSSLFSAGSSDSQDSKPPKTASPTPSESGGKLSKVKNRVPSVTHLAPDYPPPPPPKATEEWPLTNPSIRPLEHTGLDAADASTSTLEVPAAALDVPFSNEPQSRTSSRPGTPSGDGPDGRLQKARRRSRLFGGSLSGERPGVNTEPGRNDPLAWIVGHQGKVPYNLTMLLNGEHVPELWDEEGDTLVYLFPRTSDKGPSFRIDSSVYAASQLLTRLVHGSLYSDQTYVPPLDLTDRSSRPVSETYTQQSRTASPDQSQIGSSDGSKGSRALSDAVEDDFTEKHLYLPISLSSDAAFTPHEPQLTAEDTDTLVAYRNFFAFLIGQSLVATQRFSNIFDIFIRISDILSRLNFSNVDARPLAK